MSKSSTVPAGAIRRVLRCKHSGQYFTGEGWSENIEQAQRFSDSVEAAQACAHLNLTGVEMVLRVSGSDVDLFVTDIWPRPELELSNPMVL